MAKFEAEILYEVDAEPVVSNFAPSIGWSVETINTTHIVLRGDGDNEDELLADVGRNIAVLEEEGAVPVNYRVIRVIYDSASGYDEITTTRDDEDCFICGPGKAFDRAVGDKLTCDECDDPTCTIPNDHGA